MAKRQNFVVGSTNAVTETMTTSELNHGFDRYEVLTADKLDGTLNSVSDYSNDSSNEIANAIQSITGAQPTGSSENELANALQQMRNEIETTSLTFKGYVATSAPSSSTYALVEGNIWINSATMPTSFPVAASSIKRWSGTSWVNYGSTYTPADFDFFRNINDNEGYYWFGGQWTVMSTDMSTTYFTLNQSTGKWEIKSSVNLPGSPTTTTPDAADKSTKIATTQFARNFGQRYVSNCITEIPQDINLELNAGTLTLKAGSKVYVPNGSGVFDTVTIESDKTITAGGTTTLFVYYRGTGLSVAYLSASGSGSPTPAATTSYGLFYNTTDNKIYFDNGSWLDSCSLPIAIVSTTGGQITSIDQVFNGFGYIGSTVFALPGVKALIPDGRNTDGTLKSRLDTLASVKTSDGYTCKFMFNAAGLSAAYFTNYAEQDTQPSFTNGTWYNPLENKMYQITNNVASRMDVAYVLDVVLQDADHVKSVTPKLPFRAVDYSNFANTIANINDKFMGAPDWNNVTQVSTDTYTALENGYFMAWQSGSNDMNLAVFVNQTNTSYTDYGYRRAGGANTSHAGGVAATVPVAKGDVITVTHGSSWKALFIACKKI